MGDKNKWNASALFVLPFMHGCSDETTIRDVQADEEAHAEKIFNSRLLRGCRDDLWRDPWTTIWVSDAPWERAGNTDERVHKNLGTSHQTQAPGTDERGPEILVDSLISVSSPPGACPWPRQLPMGPSRAPVGTL